MPRRLRAKFGAGKLREHEILMSLIAMRRILAICTSHIGGVLLLTPALELLRRFFPEAEISVLVRQGTEVVLENNPFIKAIYTDGKITSNQQMHESSKSSFATRLSQVPRGLRLIRELRRQHFDLAIDFNGSDRAAILAFFSGAKERVGYKPTGGFMGKSKLFTQLYSEPPQPNHRVLEMAELVLQFGSSRSQNASGRPPVGGLVLKPTAENLRWADAQWAQLTAGAGPRVLVHPTSRVMYKCWAPARWAEVITRLQESFHARVMLTCSPDANEIKMAEVILNSCSIRPNALLGKLNLGQLAALIQRADLFSGVDSAPMHIAAAVGTPVVAVFGPSSDVIWGPWGKGNRVVRRPCPCLESKKTHCLVDKGMECLNKVPVEEVYQAAAVILSAVTERETRE